jgi:hypothetical protein
MMDFKRKLFNERAVSKHHDAFRISRLTGFALDRTAAGKEAGKHDDIRQ